MKFDLQELNTKLREQFENVENSPMLAAVRMMTENLRDTEVEDFIPEIVGAMQINISQYVWNTHREEVEALITTMSDAVISIYRTTRKFMEHDEAVRYVVAASSSLSLTLDL